MSSVVTRAGAAAEPPRERPATVHDVAALAGVSAQTVSRLVAGYTGIRPVTRQRVESAIAELGYRPNRAARQLRTQRSTRIGVVVHEMFAYGPARLIRGAGRRAREHGYLLNIIGVDGDDEQAVAAAFEAFDEERVAGILAVTLTDSVRRAVDGRVPEVPILVDPVEDHLGGAGINELGTALVARHLSELGHRRVGMVLGPSTWLPARQRAEGFRAELARHGVECTRTWAGDWTMAAGARAAADFDLADGITAVFGANDALALGFLAGLARRGIRVPEQVSVAGFDASPEGQFASPTLTSAWADYEEQGAAALDVLLAQINGTDPAAAPASVRLRTGGSTAAPGGRSTMSGPATTEEFA